MHNKFCGVYNGVVASTNDPKGLSRVRLKVPQLLGKSLTNWAAPLGWLPGPVSVGEKVLVQFISGNITLPLYSLAPTSYPSVYPTGWAELSFLAGYGTKTGAYSDFGYSAGWRMVGPKTVEMRGTVDRTGSDFIATSLIASLGAITPQQLCYFTAASSGATGTGRSSLRVEARPDGNLAATFGTAAGDTAYTTKWLSLDGWTYDLV